MYERGKWVAVAGFPVVGAVGVLIYFSQDVAVTITYPDGMTVTVTTVGLVTQYLLTKGINVTAFRKGSLVLFATLASDNLSALNEIDLNKIKTILKSDTEIKMKYMIIDLHKMEEVLNSSLNMLISQFTETQSKEQQTQQLLLENDIITQQIDNVSLPTTQTTPSQVPPSPSSFTIYNQTVSTAFNQPSNMRNPVNVQGLSTSGNITVQKKGTEIPKDIVLTLRLVAFIEELYVKLNTQTKSSQPDKKLYHKLRIVRNQLLHCSQRPRQHDAEQEKQFNNCSNKKFGHDLFAHGNYKDIFQEHFGTTCLLCIRNIVNSYAENNRVEINKGYIYSSIFDKDLDYLLFFRAALHEAEKILDESYYNYDNSQIRTLLSEDFYNHLNDEFKREHEIEIWKFLYMCNDKSWVKTEEDDLMDKVHKFVDDNLKQLKTLQNYEKKTYLKQWKQELRDFQGQKRIIKVRIDKEELFRKICDHCLDELLKKSSETENKDTDENLRKICNQYGIEDKKILSDLKERYGNYGIFRSALMDHNLLINAFKKEFDISIETPDLHNEVDLLNTVHDLLKLRDGDACNVKQKIEEYLKKWPEALLILKNTSALTILKQTKMFKEGFDSMVKHIASQNKQQAHKESTNNNNRFALLQDIGDE
jgi:hypothetical protein